MASVDDKTPLNQNHLRTSSDYEIAVGWWPLSAQSTTAVPFVAVLGRGGISLPSVVLLQVLRAVSSAETKAVSAEVLLYLAATGRLSAGRRAVRVPIPDAQGRRQLRRLEVLLDRRTLTKRIDWSAARVIRGGLSEDEFRVATMAEQNICADLLTEKPISSARTVQTRVERLLREWVNAGTHERPDVVRLLQGFVTTCAADDKPEHLAALVSQVERGRQLYHWAIQHHQQRALAEARVLLEYPEVAAAFAQGTGLHALLYQPGSLPGAETWGCRLTPAGRICVVLPQLVLYGRYRLGEDWLRALVAAHARGDNDEQRRTLDALSPVVEAVATYRLVGTPVRSLFATRRTRRGLQPGHVELDQFLKTRTFLPEILAVGEEELEARLVAYDQTILTLRGGLSKAEAEMFAALVMDPKITTAEYAKEHGLPWSTAADIRQRMRRKLRRLIA